MADGPTGGGLIADQLVAHGVKTVFSLAGAGHTHLLLPLEDRGVRVIGNRHETGAVGAADGYARATGGIGVALIIAEQGLPNAITALQTAFLYGSPVLVLVTRFPNSWVEAAGELVDRHASIASVTKWARTVPSADKLGEYVETAMRIAQSGRPGPVVLVMPQDYLATPVPPSAKRPSPVLPLPAGLSDAALTRITEMLSAAKRPAILVDSECRGEAAAGALAALTDRHDLPVFGYGGGRGLVAESDDRGILPWPFAQIALPQCDLLIVAGGRLNMWFGFGRAPRFPDDLAVIQIDADCEAIGRNRAVTLGAVADPGTALAQIAAALEQAGAARWSQAWLDDALAPRRAAITETAERATASPAIHTLSLVTAVQAARPADGILIVDGADILNWSHAAFRVARPLGYMDHHPMGSMGIALPLAVGAAAAEQDLATEQGRPVIPALLMSGDGAFGFYLAEVETIARAGLPLKIVVANDAQWGTEYHGQRLMTGRDVNTRLSLVDFARVAEGLGIAAATVTAPADLAPALSDLFADDAPRLLDVRTDPAAGAALKTDPRLSFLIFSDLAPPAR